MSRYTALVSPRKWVTDGPGWCLRYAQSFFGAPAFNPSAWSAWNYATHKHGPNEPLPDVPCLLWFSHWGTYGSPAYYDNWGHVTPYVPGDAIYSSPAGSYWGFDRYSTIAEVERVYNSKYVGWSEDINGLRVCQPAPVAPPKPIKPERKITVGRYHPKSNKRQNFYPAKSASVRKNIRINDSGSKISLLGSKRKAQLTVSVWFALPKSEAGKAIELTLFADRFNGGKTTSRRSLHSETYVVPPNGFVRAQITTGVHTSDIERVRCTLRNDSGKVGNVHRVTWDIFE